jgi:prepilin-type N-terminal cleavage/methylation domain-containing protein
MMDVMLRRRSPQAGFTLIEMMVVVALIAILAAIAIPSFFGDARKSKASSEVGPIFNDLRTRLDQYFQENGQYPATIGEATTQPTTPTSSQQTILPLPATWTAVKIRITNSTNVYCGYTWATGLASDSANVGTVASTSFAFTPPATPWYYLLAHCDMDGVTGTANDSYYFSSSVDPTIKKLNEGK